MSLLDSRSVRGNLIELVVVVGGILIAFALDAWWDGRGLVRWEQEQLMGLEAEFEVSLEGVRGAATQHETRATHVRSILEFAAGSPAGATEEFPDSVVSAIVAWRTTNLSIGSLDALLASGDLGNLSSNDLRAVLAQWPRALADLEEDEALGREFVEMVLAPALAGQGILVPAYAARSARLGIRAGLTDSTRQQVVSNLGVTTVVAGSELADLLAARLTHLRLASGSVRQTEARIQETLGLIQAELAR